MGAFFEKFNAAHSLNCIPKTELAKSLVITWHVDCKYGQTSEQGNGVCLLIEYAESGQQELINTVREWIFFS